MKSSTTIHRNSPDPADGGVTFVRILFSSVPYSQKSSFYEWVLAQSGGNMPQELTFAQERHLKLIELTRGLFAPAAGHVRGFSPGHRTHHAALDPLRLCRGSASVFRLFGQGNSSLCGSGRARTSARGPGSAYPSRKTSPRIWSTSPSMFPTTIPPVTNTGRWPHAQIRFFALIFQISLQKSTHRHRRFPIGGHAQAPRKAHFAHGNRRSGPHAGSGRIRRGHGRPPEALQ